MNAIDTLIGDITPPEALMKTLTDRKIAEQEQVTYKTQQLAEETRKDLQQAKAMADTQARVVDAERSVSIAEFAAQAVVKQASGEAQSKTINADADGKVIITVGNAEAEKTKAVGTAEADVIKMKIASMESGNYAAVQIAQALAIEPHQAGSGYQAGRRRKRPGRSDQCAAGEDADRCERRDWEWIKWLVRGWKVGKPDHDAPNDCLIPP